MSSPSARDRFDALCAKIDGFFSAAAARFPGEGGVTCAAGCADCCRRRFSVTAIEAEVIMEALAALPEPRRRELAARARDAEDEACPALDPDGRCAIYAARPLICRSHGLPIRFPSERRGALPVLDACPRNFIGRDLAALPAEVVLDQGTVSTILAALDAARAGERGRARGERIEIAALLG